MGKRFILVLSMFSFLALVSCHKSTCPAYGDLTTKMDKNGNPKGKPKSNLFPSKMR